MTDCCIKGGPIRNGSDVGWYPGCGKLLDEVSNPCQGGMVDSRILLSSLRQPASVGHWCCLGESEATQQNP